VHNKARGVRRTGKRKEEKNGFRVADGELGDNEMKIAARIVSPHGF